MDIFAGYLPPQGVIKPSVCTVDNFSLPPCRVCGAKASGFHYGVNTCEACKGFFRRSLQRKDAYRCLKNRDCSIIPGKRHICAACRYNKCLQEGMSMRAIKTGRYTQEKRCRDIEEVKELEQRSQLKKVSRPEPNAEDRESELEDIIQAITSINLQQTPHTPEFYDELPKRESQFLERRALQEEIFGPMKPLSRDEYRHIYQTTGIDIDGRRALISKWLPGIEKAIKRFIAFAKALPGFKRLPIVDQISIIKASFDEFYLLSSYHLADRDNKLWNDPDNDDFVVTKEEWLQFYESETIEFYAKCVLELQELELLPEEQSLLLGYMLLTSDAILSEKGTVLISTMRDEIFDAFHMLIQQHHDEGYSFISRVVSSMVRIKTLIGTHMKQDDVLKNDYHDLEWTPIIRDVCLAKMYPLLDKYLNAN